MKNGLVRYAVVTETSVPVYLNAGIAKEQEGLQRLSLVFLVRALVSMTAIAIKTCRGLIL
jgi:hypothetical protein